MSIIESARENLRTGLRMGVVLFRAAFDIGAEIRLQEQIEAAEARARHQPVRYAMQPRTRMQVLKDRIRERIK